MDKTTPCERVVREQITPWCAVHNKHYSDCYVDILNAELSTLRREIEGLRKERDRLKDELLRGFMREDSWRKENKLLKEVAEEARAYVLEPRGPYDSDYKQKRLLAALAAVAERGEGA